MPQKDINNRFEELYKMYFRKIYNYVYYLSQDKNVAEEICEDTFTKTYEYLRVSSAVIENMHAWLFKCARNAYINYCRIHRRYVSNEIALSHLVESDNKLDDEIEFKKIIKTIDTKLTPSIYKEVLILKYKFELSNEEVASALDISTDNARQICKRALDKLKKII